MHAGIGHGWESMSGIERAAEFEALLKRLGKDAFPVAAFHARRANTTPEDLLQEAHLIVLGDPSKLDPEFPESSFRAIVRNVGLNARKRHAHRLKPMEAGVAAQYGQALSSSSPSDAPDAPERTEVKAMVREEISLLPAAQRQALLNQLAGVPTAEAAAQTGRSEFALNKDGFRGRERLSQSGRLRRLAEYLSLAPLLRRLRERSGARTAALTCATVAVIAVAVVYVHGSGSTDSADSAGSHDVAGGSGGSGSSGTTSGTGGRGDSASPAFGDRGRTVDAGGSGGSRERVDGGEEALVDEIEGLETGGAKPSKASGLEVVDVPGKPGLKLHRIWSREYGLYTREWTTLHGKRHGTDIYRRSNGTIMQTVEYQNDVKHGMLKNYDEDGETVWRYSIWESDVKVKSERLTLTKSDREFAERCIQRGEELPEYLKELFRRFDPQWKPGREAPMDSEGGGD